LILPVPQEVCPDRYDPRAGSAATILTRSPGDATT
jgi:hypothetical protein